MPPVTPITIGTRSPMFSPEKLARTINEVIPPEKRQKYNTFVVGTVDEAGAQVAVVVTKTIRDGAIELEASAAGRYEWTGNKGAGAKLLISFK